MQMRRQATHCREGAKDQPSIKAAIGRLLWRSDSPHLRAEERRIASKGGTVQARHARLERLDLHSDSSCQSLGSCGHDLFRLGKQGIDDRACLENVREHLEAVPDGREVAGLGVLVAGDVLDGLVQFGKGLDGLLVQRRLRVGSLRTTQSPAALVQGQATARRLLPKRTWTITYQCVGSRNDMTCAPPNKHVRVFDVEATPGGNQREDKSLAYGPNMDSRVGALRSHGLMEWERTRLH